jgi:hypothetical protein
MYWLKEKTLLETKGELAAYRNQIEPLRRREGELLRQLLDKEVAIASLQEQVHAPPPTIKEKSMRSPSPTASVASSASSRHRSLPNRSQVSFAADTSIASSSTFLPPVYSPDRSMNQTADTLLHRISASLPTTDPSLSLSTDIQLHSFRLPAPSTNDTLHRLDQHIADFEDPLADETIRDGPTHVQNALEELISQAMAHDVTITMNAGEAASVVALTDMLNNRINAFADQ